MCFPENGTHGLWYNRACEDKKKLGLPSLNPWFVCFQVKSTTICADELSEIAVVEKVV